MGTGLWLAGSFLMSASPGRKALSIVHTPVARRPGQHPKWHKKWREYSQKKRKNQKSSLWKLKNVLLLPNSFVFLFFFLWDLWEQCQQLIIFSIHQHFEFKLAALLLWSNTEAWASLMLLLSHYGYTQMTALRILRMSVSSKQRDLLMAQLQGSKSFLYLQL